jgi:hypothetical protein
MRDDARRILKNRHQFATMQRWIRAGSSSRIGGCDEGDQDVLRIAQDVLPN